jgi:act minimal PKS acyl carrier protein
MATTMKIDDLRRILLAGAGELEGVRLDETALDAEFDALGYDSLALLETAARIGREYGVELDDDAATSAKTPRGLLELVNGALAETASRP